MDDHPTVPIADFANNMPQYEGTRDSKPEAGIMLAVYRGGSITFPALPGRRECEMDCERIITQKRLKELAHHEAEWCLSIYVPIGSAGEEAKRGRINFKNLLDEGRGQLARHGVEAGQVDTALRSLDELMEDHGFWLENHPAVAFFISQNFITCFRVPQMTNSIVAVGPHFNVVPLIPFVDDRNGFYLLSLEQNRTRLFRGNAMELAAVEVPDMPPGRDDTIGREQFEKETEHMKQAPGLRRTRAGSYHGVGPGVDAKKVDAQRYLQRVEKAVGAFMKDKSKPLILAGVPFLISGYREINEYPYLLDGYIEGNVRTSGNDEILERCRSILSPRIEKEEKEAFSRYQEIKSKKSNATSVDIEKITKAAYIGKVDELFIDKDSQLWGKIQSHDGIVEARSDQEHGDVELVSTAAAEAFTHKARLHIVEKSHMPDDGAVAAVFRP